MTLLNFSLTFLPTKPFMQVNESLGQLLQWLTQVCRYLCPIVAFGMVLIQVPNCLKT